MKTPSELLLYDKIFNKFRKKPTQGEMLNHYDSKILLTPQIQKRSDLFNVFLKK